MLLLLIHLITAIIDPMPYTYCAVECLFVSHPLSMRQVKKSNYLQPTFVQQMHSLIFLVFEFFQCFCREDIWLYCKPWSKGIFTSKQSFSTIGSSVIFWWMLLLCMNISTEFCVNLEIIKRTIFTMSLSRCIHIHCSKK